tara:strand:- start:2509 stop:3066 length:558 start_codon:yes stop_codon:yes gene_type:complete
MWEEEVKDVFWTNYNFLNDEYIDSVLKYSQQHGLVEIEQKDTHYKAYADALRYQSKYTQPIITELNKQYKILFNKTITSPGLSSLQFVKKRFVPNKSFYKLHKEIPSIYGECVFMFYLTNEIDGDLVIPEFNYRITPKRNLCVIMRTGYSHLVENCTGEREVITGWSFAPYSRLTKNLRKNYDKL